MQETRPCATAATAAKYLPLSPGSWGGYYTSTTQHQGAGASALSSLPGVSGSVNSTVTCFFDNFTRQGPCNATNPAWWWMQQALGAVGSVNDDITRFKWV